MMKRFLNNKFTLFVILVTFLFLFFIGMESVAFARAGGGRSSGSRGFSSGSGGSRTTPTRPPSNTQQRTQQPTTQAPPIQQSQPSFGRSLLYGIGGGLVGGMIGSMLFGGRGNAGVGGGGWGSGGFGFGDIIILLVIAGIIYFVYKKYRARKAEEMQMSAAGAGYSPSYTYSEPASEPVYEPAAPQQEDPVSQGLRHIREMDSSFDDNRFKELAEDYFFKIQSGWTKRDLSNVRNLLAPQMLSTFQTDINNYIANKQINRLENIAMRQVEIVDAVQDQGEEYITVKFLANILDYTVDDTSNQLISGNSTDPVKFLEYWTFTRKIGDRNWILAGITQEADY
jgi:predicted lipid-binding transport protein (Tim44 family)